MLKSAERCLVMGVVNVTPDSFSDGGRWLDPDTAIAHGLEMVARGADIIDVGGESTRPGAERISAEEELRRVIPVITGLTAAGATVSVDTMRAQVAEASLAAGAYLVNDVSGGRADPALLKVAAEANVPFLVMHWREHSATMQNSTHYDDVVADVVAELAQQVDEALAAGVHADNIVVDPGLGFSKTGAQNWTVLKNLDAFAELGYPVLVAASRKRFLGELLGDSNGIRGTEGREAATAAVSALAAFHGAWCVRVHEVPATLDAVRVARRWTDG